MIDPVTGACLGGFLDTAEIFEKLDFLPF